MRKLLFVNEKWPANVKEYGPSSSDHVLLSAFKNTNLGDHRAFHFDEYFYEHNKKGDFKLLEEVIDYKPDLIVYSWLAGFHNPEVDTIKLIHKLGHKIVCIWWDFMWPKSMEAAELLSPFIDAHIIMDNPFAPFQIPMHSKRKHLPLWTPNDQTLFYGDPNSKRLIDIQFCGDITGGGKYREEYIKKLEKLKYNVFISGKSKDKREPIKGYTDKLRQTKIVPNLSNGLLKGRIFETTLCGAMLMEPEKSVCSAYFVKGKEYVPYEDEKDYFDKIRYYLEHENERLEIAVAGHKRVNDKYNTRRFWRIVLNKVGLLDVDENELYGRDRMQIDDCIEQAYNPIEG